MRHDFPFLRTRLITKEEILPKLLDVSAFIYDVNFLYEIYRLSLDEKYSEFDFSKGRNIHYRWGRPLDDGDRLRLVKLSHQSPFEIITVIPIVGAAIAAIWGTVQIIDKVSTIRLKRENIELNNRKLELEIRKLRSELEEKEIIESRYIIDMYSEKQLLPQAREDAKPYVESMEKNLLRSPIVVRDYKLDVIEDPVETDSIKYGRRKSDTD